MQTKSIVQASANVIRITNLAQGDIYKRFDDSSYSRSTFFGIVKAIYNDGEKTYIEAVEYKKSYSEMEASIYVMRGDNDVSIFPATLEEIQEEFASCAKSIEKKIAEKREEIAKLEGALDTTNQLVSGELQKKLQTPVFKEFTQAEFNQKLLDRERASLTAETL
ncbi:hypothetical protein [Sphingomonas sp. 35-24ZXX]|uniref:hypothetical protein n=1 Tax=Sphingomonas sp. 35-24ZXX TaxID=1545915 RepID=UPI00053BDD21|nr:hypothetical protein [Sphingomonas sp. 35-24ZXX]